MEAIMNNRLRTDIKITQLDNAQEVAKALVKRLLLSAQNAIKQRHAFHCVLAGGSSPQKVYKLLSKAESQWSQWHLYLGDERVLAQDEPERNSFMIEQSWLNKLTAPLPHWHPIATELNREQAIASYTNLLAPIKQFDMVLLGIGEDGHTASLFPGHHHPQNNSVLAINNAPKPPAERVSLSQERLGKTREIIVIVTRKSKQSAMLQWLDGINLPIAQVVNKAIEARVELFIDRDACPDLLR